MNEATIDKSAARIRRMFGQIAHRYDRMNHLLSMQIDRYWRWRTVRKVAPSGNAPILDVCTGTGDLAFAYRKKSDPEATVIGTDFCHEMLQVARRRQHRKPPASALYFAEADTLSLPFRDHTFQIVSVAFGLRNVSDTDRGLREMTRVCREGGQVTILEFSMPKLWPIRQIYGFYFRRILPRIGQWLARNKDDAYEYLPESVKEFPSGEALAERMTKAGLSQVRYFPLTFGVATMYVGKK